MNKSIAMLLLGGALLPVASFAGVRDEMAKRNVKMRAAEAEVMLRPYLTDFYEFDQPTNDWKFLNKKLHNYSKGAVLSEELNFNPVFPEKTKFSYSYYENGTLKEKTESFAADGENFTNVSKIEYIYDDVTGSLLSSINHVWNSEKQSWEIAPGAIRETVTRNAQGYVTLIQNESYINGAWKPTLRNEFVYIDGKQGANDMLVYNYDDASSTWVIQDSGLYNIVWENTDCQYISVLSNFLTGANRIKSAEQGDEKNGRIVMQNSFSENGYSSTSSFKASGLKISGTKYEIDAKGNITSLTEYYDETGNVSNIYKAVTLYDGKGNLESYTELIGTSVETAYIFSKWTYDYKYYNDGSMSEMSSYRLDTTSDIPETYIPVEKEVYQGYFDAASAVVETEGLKDTVIDITANDVTVKGHGMISTRIFNISGACVGHAQGEDEISISTDGLPAGIYVVDAVSAEGHTSRKFVK